MSTITGTNFAEYNFNEIIETSTFKGLTIVYDINGVVQDITDYTFNLTWRINNAKGRIVRESDETDGITITDAVNGEFQIDSFVVDFDQGTYYYDLKITDDNDITDIRMYGEMIVKQNATP